MNIEEYISSGILEQYVLGGLTEAERREVEQYAREYPAIRAELDAIEAALASYARLHGRPLPAGFEEGVLRRLRTEAPPAAAAPAYLRWTRLAAAAVAGALIAGAAVFMFSRQPLHRELQRVRAELAALRADCEQTQQQIYALRDTATRQIRMGGLTPAPDALTVVYWNPDKRTSFLDIVRLPAPPPGKQYQLWAIVGGQPADMGVLPLQPGAGGLLSVPFVENPQAFAITLEDEGGSPTPTLDQMYVVGNVG